MGTVTTSTLAADIAALSGASAAFAVETRANIATIAANHSALADLTGRLANAVDGQSAILETVVSDVRKLQSGKDRAQRTSTPASGVRETAPKARRTRRTVSDPTGRAAVAGVALANLTERWAKPTASDHSTLKLAAVNALRKSGLTDSQIYGLIMSGDLLSTAQGADCSVAVAAADSAVADAIAAPVVRGKSTGRIRRILLNGYTVTVTAR